MFEDPELQDPLTLNINESYENQNLSHHDQRIAPPSCDYSCEAPHIQVVIKEEEGGWTVTETNESYFFRGETADNSAKVWNPHFKAHGKESYDSYKVKGQRSEVVVCDPSCSAKPEIFSAYETTAGHLTVVECSDLGKESVSYPLRETTQYQDKKSNFNYGANHKEDCLLSDQNQDVEQSTCLPTGAEPHETKTSAFCQTASPGCKSLVTPGLTMASSNLEDQTLRLTVRLQAEEVEEEEEEERERDEEIGGFINSDGEVFDWDDSPDRSSDHMESPQHDTGHDVCKSHMPGPTQRYSSPTLIMEVVGDDDEKIEIKDNEKEVEKTTVSCLNSGEKRQRERRKKNKVLEKPASTIHDSDAEKQVISTPEKRRSKRKISEVPPSYEGLDAEPEVSRRSRRRKKVPTTAGSEESKPKTVRRTTERTRQVKRTWKKTKEIKPSAEGAEDIVVPAVKKAPGRKRLCVPVEIPPELLKKPKEKIDYQCSVCGKEFPHAYKLERHELIHTGEKPYCCSICGRGFNQKGNLKTHYKVHYGQKGVPDFEDEVTPIASELSEYLKSLPGESKIRSSLHCLECGKDCESQSSLQAHHVTAHAQTAPEPDTAEHNPSHDLICNRCDIQFKDKEKLDEHMKTHIKEKRFACPDCGKRFINESYIHIHRRIHTGERPYLCSQCGRGFHTASSLKIHEVQHSEERPFACSICGKRFRMNSYLIAHYQTHIIDRPYICSVCGKGYSRIEELKVHQRLHTGERPYECGECGKSFIYRQGLRQHQRTHAGRRMGPTRQLGRPKQQARLDVQQQL